MNLELEAYEGELKALRQAAEMALEALETDQAQLHWKIVRALRQALAQKQEPVAYVSGYYCGNCIVLPTNSVKVFKPGTALYTAPPKREWQGLTDEEVRQAYCSVGDKEWSIGGMRDAGFFAELIEAKLKEKNT